ncbi:MAG: hypothetical protein DHS20C15_24480 [Planctomycetota bacterium]|nr:MAG: hypothetical protein DHS20C15_24480 [Planctomycetota bacterium]
MPRLPLLAVLIAALAACAAPSHERWRQIPPGHDGAYTIWWSDDQPKERGEALGGQRHGEIERFHPDGSLSLRGEFVSGVPEGRVEQFYPNDGGLQVAEHRVAGLLQGDREEFYPNGSLRRRTPYVRDLREGLEEGWHRDGALALRREWRAGLGSGRWEEFDSAGNLLRTEHRWLADGEEVGYLETVYTGPERVSIQTLMRRHAGVWSGWETHWHENGVQAGYVEYEGGRRQGLDRSWARNGQLVVEGWRIDDKRHGIWRTWSQNGALIEELEYSLGEQLTEPSAPEG